MLAHAGALLLFVAAGLLCVPAISDGVSWWRRRQARADTDRASASPRLLFLVPAHNEAWGIEPCVRSVLEMDYPAEARGVVVIADNCTDETADLASAAGARCLIRDDPFRRGKPYALAWALERARLEEWDACVVLDADSVVDRGFAGALAAEAPLRNKILQTYFGTANEWESWLTRLSGILTRVRYEYLYPLKRAAGLNCPLTGNGMCLGSDLLRRDGWRALSLTENWELYAQYTAGGVPIRYVEDARLYSQEASSLRQGATQRRRWLAGRIWVAKRWAGRLLASDRIGWHQKLDALAELACPSPALHLALALGVAGAAWHFLPRSLAAPVMLTALISLSSLGTATVAALGRHPQPVRSLAALLMLPPYALWRVVLALVTLLTLKATTWTRTERRAQPPSPSRS